MWEKAAVNWRWRCKQTAICFATLISFLVLGLTPMHAQSTVGTGSINGVVTDASGAVVSGATVTITNTGTNLVIRLTSNSAGAYTSGALTPGEYRVQISAKGFSSASQTLPVQVGNT